jgi:hypothetical protein
MDHLFHMGNRQWTHFYYGNMLLRSNEIHVVCISCKMIYVVCISSKMIYVVCISSKMYTEMEIICVMYIIQHKHAK